MSQTTTERTAPAHGAHTEHGRPRNATTLTPFIVVRDAASAIAFYEQVLGARVLGRTNMPGADGSKLVAHAELDMGDGLLQLGDAMPAYHLVPPSEGEDVCFSLGYYCPDVDVVVERAVAAGAVLREPPTTFVSGDRFASIRDPFGIRWTIMTRVEDISPEESGRRVSEYFASFSQSSS